MLSDNMPSFNITLTEILFYTNSLRSSVSVRCLSKLWFWAKFWFRLWLFNLKDQFKVKSHGSRKPPECKGMSYKTKSKKTNILAAIWTRGIYSVLASLTFHLLFNTFLTMSRMVQEISIYMDTGRLIYSHFSEDYCNVKVNCAIDLCRDKTV